MMPGLLFVSLCVGFLGLSLALLEPIPFPASLQECYEYRSYNMTPSFEAAHQIQQYCYRNFEYQQIASGKVWSGTNITIQGINYIDSLFRQIFREVEEMERQNKNGRRTKRQTIGRRYRREVRSPGAYQPFADCIVRLQNQFVEDPSTGRNTYQTLAAFHSGQALRTAHGGPGFAPWHRIYLLLLETACGAPIPYWESGLDHDMEDPTASILWSDDFFGNGNGVVTTGPFRSMRTILGGPIIRNYGTGEGALFTKTGYNAVLSRTRYDDISEPKQGAAYFFTLEGHHNGPHTWTGGHLARPNSAPYDPVFYMHHSYVDAVYEAFRQRQRQNGINPETDYPVNTPPGHGFDDLIDFRPYINQITNRYAMSDAVANLVTYEPFANCRNRCNGSPHLYCQNGVCVSRNRPTAAPSAAFAFGDSTGAFRRNEERMIAEAAGPIPAGEKFRTAPLRDIRNQEDRLGIAPVAPEIQAASMQVREVQARFRRDVSHLSKNESLHHGSHQSISSIGRSFTNSFILDGVVDQKRWVYVPVRIVYTRSPNVKGTDPTLLGNSELQNDVCQTAHSGASKVFVASDGLDYYGNYKEFAIIDERQPVSVTTTAVGIKNPEFGEGEVLFTSYDSCGRPCRPLCLTSVNGQQKYKACSGAFKISSAAPTLYRNSYKEAISVSLSSYNLVDSSLDDASPPVTFVCGNDNAWPWVY
ncbi:uncharacterized protein LOC128190628 [Crassostrea angulata]|uniref:uncharacterized protein LOC128190628 n=1 Tax=Magallana angulata TaxID=2784310 RepID=UPI0022B1A463|nr:uncharacterized protein LOC128190628 [Crassostrea angulata]